MERRPFPMDHPEEGHEEPAHLEIQMAELNPFVPAAEVLPERAARLHRITPKVPVGVMDGRQIRTYNLRSQRHSRAMESNLRPRVRDELPAEENEFTEAQREWFRNRETRREEERRSPWSTAQKGLCLSAIVFAIFAITAFTVWYFWGPEAPPANWTFPPFGARLH
ncbi:hypothetical protein AVEN_20116-1 [Araneus ventricosus]|uniref:Uncharacterized protein n=1 Tax=Araneus ventricosus TaxID=182803 RepID=A0A4Y2VF01_ARAVE|nr:hypothetical protein AVEN_20116-1 [Araneus ventricosus]